MESIEKVGSNFFFSLPLEEEQPIIVVESIEPHQEGPLLLGSPLVN